MVVNFEFLGREPMENLITCMNFKVDKVVFFGYQEVIDAQRKCTEQFLKEYCHVLTVGFHPLSHKNLQSMLKTMREIIQYERGQENQIYFDITGGESLILVAFGMLSREFETPMHMFDIAADRLIELDEGAEHSISKDVKQRKIPLTLDLLVKMHGGIINTNLQKSIKGIRDNDFMENVDKIFQIAAQDWDLWNPFSELLRNTFVSGEELRVSKSAYVVRNAVEKFKPRLNIRKLNKLLDDLKNAGVLEEVRHENGQYGFKFKTQEIKECLWEGGSVLELHTYQTEAQNSNECQVGVHIDWDGVIHDQPGIDVLNEIDVLSLKGNVPTFISCKSGKMGRAESLNALYELETVASRFGGKYARKILVTAQNMADVYKERAKEMGIEVR